MTTRRSSRRHRAGRLLAELQRDLRPVARPNVLVLIWRWRYELALLIGFSAVIILVRHLSSWRTLAEIAVAIATLAILPEARLWMLAHARCVITTHRVRTGCAQAWIHSRHGKLPIILLARPRLCGERVYIWCRAGTCLEDFESASDILRSACWAHDVHVTASSRYSHIVILDVIR